MRFVAERSHTGDCGDGFRVMVVLAHPAKRTQARIADKFWMYPIPTYSSQVEPKSINDPPKLENPPCLFFDEVVSGRSFRMYPDRRWVNPMADATAENPSGKLDLSWRRVDRDGALDVNCRPWFFTNYYSVSPGMLSQIPGKGAFYIMAFTDSDGAPLAGGTNYRLNLPKDVPAANFWSVTMYEAENASGLANGQQFPSFGSRDNPVQNADGSTDLYLGRRAPEGKEKNWLATVPGKGYFAILRLYGPTEPALTKTWKPDDVAKMK